MTLRRNLIGVLCLLTIVWLSFLLVAYILASTLFPALEQASQNLFLSVLRVLVGLSIFSAWVIFWYLLTRLWLYRALLRET